MSPEANEKKNEIVESQPFTEMDVKDETQILQEMKGEKIEQYVYQYVQREENGKSHTVTSLSYVGIKEAIRRRGRVSIVGEAKVEETETTIRAMVKMHDGLNDLDVLGVSEALKSKPFAYVLAVNKAERNAFAKLIPAKFFAELIAEKLNPQKRSDAQPQNVTPKSEPPLPQAKVIVPTHPDQVYAEFPPEVADKLNFKPDGDVMLIVPREFLGKELFADVSAIVKGMGGEYISAGRDSHFKVKIAVSKETDTSKELYP